MSFKYTRLPSFLKRTRKNLRHEERFRIDNKLDVTVQVTNPLEGEVALHLRQHCFRLADDITLGEETYDALKQEMHNIRKRINCVKLSQIEAQNDLVNSFDLKNGVTVFIRLNESRQIVVAFSNIRERFQHVILNENQFSAFENMVTRSIIDSAIYRLLKSSE